MSRRRAVSLLLIACVLAIVFSSFRVVRPGERMVVRRFGRVIEPAWGPGPHWGLPLGIDRFDRVRTDQIRRLFVSSGSIPANPSASEFLTGDLNLVQVGAVVQYRVERPGDWLVQAADVEDLLGRLSESSLSKALARRGIDAVLRLDRTRVGAEVVHELAAAVQRHRLGVEILAVSLTDARPPTEVAAEFSAAQASESERDRRGHEARTRAQTTLAAATARGESLVAAARARAQQTRLTAQAQAQRFGLLLDEANRSRTLTEHRLYLDAMQRWLGGVGRRIIVPPGDSVDLTVLGLED